MTLIFALTGSSVPNYFVSVSFTVLWPTSSLTSLDLTKQVNLLLSQHKQSSLIQTGGQPYRDTLPLT